MVIVTVYCEVMEEEEGSRKKSYLEVALGKKNASK